MIAKIPLPNETTIGIQYSKAVYDPNYSSYRDTIGLAHECIKELNPSRVIDVGCGSGVLGLALKKLNPLVDVYLTDPDPNAIKQTRRNAERLGLRVTAMRLAGLPKTQFYPVVVANLPTFDEEQMKTEPLRGPELAYKGEGADGLGLYRKLMSDLDTGAFLICEIQDKHQANFYKLLEELKVFQVVATSQMAFALFKRPVPVYEDQVDNKSKILAV